MLSWLLYVSPERLKAPAERRHVPVHDEHLCLHLGCYVNFLHLNIYDVQFIPYIYCIKKSKGGEVREQVKYLPVRRSTVKVYSSIKWKNTKT